ncbi:MAG TPA: dual specificity protein phosphatase [Anaerolineales bacterium]|nr:dual specificity protein phosphatase [Anaerolineales bacterium]
MAWITEQVLLAGAGINENNWKEVIDLGVTAVVNLRAENQDNFGAPLPFAYLWLPTEDHTDPNPYQLLVGAQMIDTLVKSGHKVLVHCKMGIHRSATMVVAFLIYSGMDKEEAIWHFKKNGSRLYGSEENHQTLDKFVKLISEK